MLVYSLKEPLAQAMREHNVQVESIDRKNEVVTIRAIDSTTGKKLMVKFNQASISNPEFDMSGVFLTDLTLYSYKKVFKSQYFVGAFARLQNMSGDSTEVRGVRE